MHSARAGFAARAAGVKLDVLVELDVGAHRCGVTPGRPAAELAAWIASMKNLRFAGLHAYQGAAQHARKPEERQAAIAAAVQQVTLTVNLLRDQGLNVDVVTGAGTGTYLLEAASEIYTEIQPGSYIFMDADYNQYEIEKDSMGAALDYLEEGLPCGVVFYDGRAISVELPSSVVREITYTEPAIRGDTSGKVLKPATISTGINVPVPLFCETGDRIEIDTATGEYKRRITG